MAARGRTGRSNALFTKEREQSFLQDMANARAEKDVEKAVEGAITTMAQEGFRALYGSKAALSFPHGTDGFLKVNPPEGTLFALEGDAALGEGAVKMGELRILIEAKRAMKFQEARDRAVVLIQALCYLKRFEAAGDALPQGTIVADQSSIFFCHSKFLEPYLDEEHDWSVAPSAAHRLLPDLLASLEADPNLTLHVECFDSPGFSMGDFLTRVGLEAQLSQVRSVKVDDKLSIEKAWLEYLNGPFGGVLTDPVLQVSLWVRLILGDPGVKLHEKFKNSLSVSSRDKKGRLVETRFPMKSNQPFSASAHAAYMTKYQRGGYTEAEKKALTAMADTLIEETKRRFHGDYWTPTLWVREAHKMIEEQLGDDWREKYVVWDPAAGTKNLTRDYGFGKLYCSTLHPEELAMAEDYNPEGTAFQYDFLNDDMELHALSQGLFDKKPGEMTIREKEAFLEEQRGKWKMPDGLLESLVYNKPIVFLGNPPYGQATNQGASSKGGISTSAVGQDMKSRGYGKASMELYLQFMHRVRMLIDTFGYTAEAHIMFFTAEKFLSGSSAQGFLKEFQDKFSFQSGFALNAGEFQGTSSSWAIVFSYWKLEDDKKGLCYSIRQSRVDESGLLEVISTGNWKAAPADTSLKVILPKIEGKYITEYAATKNGFETNDSILRGSMREGAFGYFHNSGINIQFSEKYTGMYSLCFINGNGHPISSSNFMAASTVMAIRKAYYKYVERKELAWIRGKDEFPAPSKEFQDSDEWDSFTTDCVVYSLFSHGANQTALRDYEYGTEADGSPKLWRVENQFYWGSREHVKELAQKNNAEEILEDLEGDTGERYVHKHLKGKKLSPEAQLLLDKSNAILDASFQYRVPFYYDSPLYCTIAWDMGWLQIQRMCFGRDALPAAKKDDGLQALYTEFKAAREALGEKIATRYSEDTGF